MPSFSLCVQTHHYIVALHIITAGSDITTSSGSLSLGLCISSSRGYSKAHEETTWLGCDRNSLNILTHGCGHFDQTKRAKIKALLIGSKFSLENSSLCIAYKPGKTVMCFSKLKSDINKNVMEIRDDIRFCMLLAIFFSALKVRYRGP